MVSEEDFELGDVGYAYPQGFLSFTIDCIDPGYTTDIKQYYYGLDTSSLGDFTLRKHNSNTLAYFSIDGVSIDTTDIYGGVSS
ncbi:MAG: hypothetical protein WD061_02425 [Candidatus Saccharimonadales bacterium]